jgi:hypothetical protein
LKSDISQKRETFFGEIIRRKTSTTPCNH